MDGVGHELYVLCLLAALSVVGVEFWFISPQNFVLNYKVVVLWCYLNVGNVIVVCICFSECMQP